MAEKTTESGKGILDGVNAYVEVRRMEDDRTSGFSKKLRELGATVQSRLNKKVTHVVFQEGLVSTFRKAKMYGVFIVSAQWVIDCNESGERKSEGDYPIENVATYESPQTKRIQRPKRMSPDMGCEPPKRLRRRSRDT